MTIFLKKIVHKTSSLLITLITVIFITVPVTLLPASKGLTDEQQKRLDTSVEKIWEKLPEIEAAGKKAEEAIEKLPPEAYLSSLERFKQKKLIQTEVQLTSVKVPTTKDSSVDKIKPEHPVTDKTVWRDIPFLGCLSVSGKNILQGACLGTAYGIDYLKYKNLKKVDDDLLYNKISVGKSQLISLLQKLSYDTKNVPIKDQALKTFNAFLIKECIKPSLFTFKDQLPMSLGHMAAQEGMCAMHDKFVAESSSGGDTTSNLMKVVNAAESIDATAAFLSKNIWAVSRCYNNKSNKVTIPLELLAAPFFGPSYALYFNNSHASNKNSLTKWILKLSYPEASLEWLNSYWFYLAKKTAINLRFIQQSNAYYEQQITEYCVANSKKLLTILQETNNQKELLQKFISDAQQDTFYKWRSFKYKSFNRTSMFFELATIVPALPKIYSALSSMWNFIQGK